MGRSKMYLYSVEWSHGMKQSNLPKTEALKIAADLLNDYDDVVITKQKNPQF